MTEIKTRGFSPEDEVRFLKRLEGVSHRVNLEQEVKTQLAEDFGMIQFTLKYTFKDGKIIDKLSGESVVEMTARGGVDEETESIRRIENGLKDSSDFFTWVHFSPANEKLGYPSNCVDFWRKTDTKEVTWNRIVVRDNFEGMNEIRSFLTGEEKVPAQSELVKSPIKSSLKLSELFDLFRLSEQKNSCTLEFIESVVNEYAEEFKEEFGEELTNNQEVIFRLYSACYTAIQLAIQNDDNSELLSRYQLGLYSQLNCCIASRIQSKNHLLVVC
jgi:hypothetical protein